MKSMLIVFFILLLIILLLIFPFKTRIMCHVNLLEMKGFYSVKVWKIKFLCGKIYISNSGELEVENQANMIGEEYNKSFAKQLAKQILTRLNVKKMELFFTGGFSNNSFSSAILCGTMSSFIQTGYSLLSQKYNNVKLYEDIYPTFNHDNLELTFDIVLSISILKILISVFKANRLKEIQNERWFFK